MSQIERNWDEELVSEIAMKCNDTMFNDFDKPIYAQAVYREQRMLAQRYKVLERRWSTYVGEENINVGTKWGTLLLNEIPLAVTDFASEFEVTFNGNQLTKRNSIDELQAGDYYIRYTKDDADLRELFNITDMSGNKLKDDTDAEIVAADAAMNFSSDYNYVIYFVQDQQIVKDDILFVYYTSTGRLANETTGTPVLPVKFYEELLRKSMLYIAKLGIATYQAEKKQKYKDILVMYGAEDRKGDKSLLHRNDDWVHVKPFTIY